MKTALAAFMMLAALTAPAVAGPCDTEIQELDAALANPKLPADVKAQLEDMRSQAEKLCAAGNEEEAADVLSEASSVIAQQ